MDFDQLKKQDLIDSEKLRDLKEKINLSGDDPIWAYIYVLENYHRIYEEMPAKLGELAVAEAKLIAAASISEIKKGAAEAAREAILERSEFEKNMSLIKGGLFFLFLTAAAVALGDVLSAPSRVIAGGWLSLLKSLYFAPVGPILLVGWVGAAAVAGWKLAAEMRGARRDKVI